MKKRMRLNGKIIMMLLAATLLLAGCGSNEEEQESTTESGQDIVIEETETQEEVQEVEETETQEAEVQETEEAETQEAEVQETETQTVDVEAQKTEVQKMLSETETKAAELEKKLEEDASLTQTDMNELSQEIYTVWDNALNKVWSVLKETQDEDTMNSLLEEQRAWISEKEAEAKKAGEEFAGGSMETLVVNQKAAELTKERVYVLAGYLGL